MADTTDVNKAMWALVLEHTSWFSSRVLYQTSDWLKELVNTVLRNRYRALFREGQKRAEKERQESLAKARRNPNCRPLDRQAKIIAEMEKIEADEQSRTERRLRLEFRYIEELSVPLFMLFNPTLRKECQHQFWCDEITPSLATWLGAEECKAMTARRGQHVLQHRLREMEENEAVELVRVLTDYDVEALNTYDLVFTGHIRLLDAFGKKRATWNMGEMIVAAFSSCFPPMIRHVAPTAEPVPLDARLFATCIKAGAASSDETMAEFHRLWPNEWPDWSWIHEAASTNKFNLDLAAWTRVLLRYEPIGARTAIDLLRELRNMDAALGFYDYMVAHGYHTTPGLRSELRVLGASKRLLERLPPEEPGPAPRVEYRLGVGVDGRRVMYMNRFQDLGRGGVLGVPRAAARPGDAFDMAPFPDRPQRVEDEPARGDRPRLVAADEPWHEPELVGMRGAAEEWDLNYADALRRIVAQHPVPDFPPHDPVQFGLAFQAWQDAGGFGQPREEDAD